MQQRPDEENYDIPQQFYDCEPTLTDQDVIRFCGEGFLLLEAVVPDEINRRTCDYMADHTYYEPVSILRQPWFVENVILNPKAAGAVRCLLGKDFGLPILMSQHRAECPAGFGHWHCDGGSKPGAELNYLQVFYYPQDTPPEMGPTEVFPGSHMWRRHDYAMGHFRSLRGTQLTEAPAGSIFITNYAIWHRKGRSTATGIRHLLKYNYFRTTPPKRDWIIEPGFDPVTTNFGRNSELSAQQYFWLSGKLDQFKANGAQAWPSAGARGPKYRPYGFPGDEQAL